MATDLEQRAAAARREADKAEAARIAAGEHARELAVVAADLEAELDLQRRQKIYAEMGPPIAGPIAE